MVAHAYNLSVQKAGGQFQSPGQPGLQRDLSENKQKETNKNAKQSEKGLPLGSSEKGKLNAKTKEGGQKLKKQNTKEV